MNFSIPYLNDGSGDEPKLKFYLNEDNLTDLREDTRWPGAKGRAMLESLQADGFHGIQFTHTSPPAESPIEFCTLDRINTAGEADEIVGRHADSGHRCLTVHAGWGIEEDDAVFSLVEAILTASEKHRLPVYIETHRATITQDMWRTVQIIQKFPEIRFNGDFSHYYTGQEMVYGGIDMKMEFMEPIFDRVAFIHARIGSPGQIQVAIGTANGRPATAVGDLNFLDHYKTMWTRAMRGFRQQAGPGDTLVFCPELLSRQHYYARCFPDTNGQPVEESDRYAEACLYLEIARGCWDASDNKPS
jgi:hypothetical protein